MILVVGNCAAQCPENRGNACCVDYEWDEVLGQCKSSSSLNLPFIPIYVDDSGTDFANRDI